MDESQIHHIPEYAINRFNTHGNEAIFFWDEGNVRRFTMGRCYPGEDQIYFAEQFCKLLNLKHGHDGSWQVIWTTPSKSAVWDKYTGMFKPAVPKHIMARWMNKANQPVIEVVFDQMTFDQILDWGISNCVRQCEISWLSWEDKIWRDTSHGDAEHIDDAIAGATALSGNLQKRLKRAEKVSPR